MGPWAVGSPYCDRHMDWAGHCWLRPFLLRVELMEVSGSASSVTMRVARAEGLQLRVQAKGVNVNPLFSPRTLQVGLLVTLLVASGVKLCADAS